MVMNGVEITLKPDDGSPCGVTSEGMGNGDFRVIVKQKVRILRPEWICTIRGNE
jgi:hypothetical protein